jgi:hypothetical protein
MLKSIMVVAVPLSKGQPAPVTVVAGPAYGWEAPFPSRHTLRLQALTPGSAKYNMHKPVVVSDKAHRGFGPNGFMISNMGERSPFFSC